MSTKLLLLTLGLLSGLVLASWLTLQLVKENIEAKPSDSTAPDSFATNVTYTKMDNTGEVKATFFSPHIVNYKARDYVGFEKPTVMVANKKGSPWYITADKGNGNTNAKVIHLNDNVKLRQAGKSKPDELLITTSSATIFVDEKYATTDQLVTITQGAFTVSAVGANANLAKGTVELLSNVKEIYVPTKNIKK